jgi:hypothetical protein
MRVREYSNPVGTEGTKHLMAVELSKVHSFESCVSDPPT